MKYYKQKNRSKERFKLIIIVCFLKTKLFLLSQKLFLLYLCHTLNVREKPLYQLHTCTLNYVNRKRDRKIEIQMKSWNWYNIQKIIIKRIKLIFSVEPLHKIYIFTKNISIDIGNVSAHCWRLWSMTSPLPKCLRETWSKSSTVKFKTSFEKIWLPMEALRKNRKKWIHTRLDFGSFYSVWKHFFSLRWSSLDEGR